METKRKGFRPPNGFFLRGMILLIAGVMLAGCASGVEPTKLTVLSTNEPIEPTRDGVMQEPSGEESAAGDPEFVSPPRRIISLAPSNTEILFAVGAGDQVVGRDEYSDFPPEALEVASIGDTYGELNTEAIVALEPDLVLVAEITPVEQIEALTALGLTVHQVPNPQSFDELFANLEVVGRITGQQEKASELVNQLQERVAKVEAAVSGAQAVRVFYEVDGTDPTAPWTTGAGTFQQVLIEAVGGENIAADLEGWGAMNLEQIVVRDPEVILFGEGPWVPTTSESLAGRSGWGTISAVVNGRVHGVDTNWVDRPGPRLVDALERFATVVQPDLYR